MGAILGSAPAAQAASNPSGTYIVSTNTFYVYAQSSENVDASFTKILNTANNTNSTLTISRPGAADINCTMDGTTAVGNAASDCIQTNLTAPQSGVWRFHFVGGGSGHDRYDWTINAQNGAVTIPGRTWTEEYVLEQTAPHAGINVWFQSEYGYRYQAVYNDYDGIDSTLAADGLGLVQPGTCLPHYKSINMGAGYTDYFPPAECNSAYKVFFENPASDLPATSTTWSGSTEWVRPGIVTPGVTNVGFTSTSTGSRNGNVTFNLTNYEGPLTVEVDVNNNGVYTDPVDVSIPYTAAAPGAQSVAFDGKDGNGADIPTAQVLNFRVKVDRVAEIHFLSGDVERRAGGIEVTRLNGPAGDESVIYWDDSDFASPDANRCPAPLGITLTGTSGVDSTGGVHAWTTTGCAGGSPQFSGNANNGVNGSWGDFRIINDWAFVPVDVTATFALSGYTAPTDGEGRLAETGTGIYGIILAAFGLIGVSALVAMTAIKSSRV